MRHLFSLLCLCFLITTARAQNSIDHESDFAKLDAQTLATNWEISDIGWQLVHHDNGQVLAADVPHGRGTALWQPTPQLWLRDGVWESTLTPLRSHGADSQWKTVGIGFWIDERNFWQLSLVEAPKTSQTAPFVELAQMRDGQWNAQSDDATRRPVLESSPPLQWQYGETYRLRLSAQGSPYGGARSLLGEVWQGQKRVWHIAYALEPVERADIMSVNIGRPVLATSGIVTEFSRAALGDVHTAAPPPVPVVPPYQGAVISGANKVQNATGFFGVVQRDNRWWLRDPNGALTLSIGTDHVNYDAHFSETLGYAPYARNVRKNYPDEAAWADNAAIRLKNWGFTTLGGSSSASVRYRGLAHFDNLQLGGSFADTATLVEKTWWTGFPDVFDARWEQHCDLRARKLCAEQRDNPWLAGYYLDNELEWLGKSWQPQGIVLDIMQRAPESAGKIALGQIWRDFYQNNVNDFNQDFSSDLTAFADFPNLKTLQLPQNERGKKAIDKFLDEMARRYFAVATTAIRRYDANHLICGSRFAGTAPEPAWIWAGKTCDVVSFNMYPRVDFTRGEVVDLDATLKRNYALTQKPLMLTEWSFPALDAVDSQGTPIPSQHGAGMRVDTQAQRAQAFAIMQEALLRSPFVVGSHYFMWADEPASGISKSFPEDSNYGLVDENDRAYPALTKTAAQVNSRARLLHLEGPHKATAPARLTSTPLQVPAGAKINYQQKNDANFTLDNGVLHLQSDGKTLQVLAGGNTPIELGSYAPLVQWQRGAEVHWERAQKLDAVNVVENNARRIVIDTTWSAPLAEGVPAWRAVVRLTMEAGLPYFRAQLRWIENSSAQAWQSMGYFHSTPSQIGGDKSDDTLGTPAAPNYWLEVGAWTDKSGWQFGQLPLRSDQRFSVNFWTDKDSQHPDAFRRFQDGKGENQPRSFAPGERWNAPNDEPVSLIFGLLSTPQNPRPWTNLALHRPDK